MPVESDRWGDLLLGSRHGVGQFDDAFPIADGFERFAEVAHSSERLGLIEAFANPAWVVVPGQEPHQPGLRVRVDPLVVPQGVIGIHADQLKEKGHRIILPKTPPAHTPGSRLWPDER